MYISAIKKDKFESLVKIMHGTRDHNDKQNESNVES